MLSYATKLKCIIWFDHNHMIQYCFIICYDIVLCDRIQLCLTWYNIVSYTMKQYHTLIRCHIILNNIILYYDILQHYIISCYRIWHNVFLELFIINIFLLQITPDLDLPKCVHHHTLIFAISGFYLISQ